MTGEEKGKYYRGAGPSPSRRRRLDCLWGAADAAFWSGEYRRFLKLIGIIERSDSESQWRSRVESLRRKMGKLRGYQNRRPEVLHMGNVALDRLPEELDSDPRTTVEWWQLFDTLTDEEVEGYLRRAIKDEDFFDDVHERLNKRERQPRSWRRRAALPRSHRKSKGGEYHEGE